jgi:outer membrane protein assembly factor BamD
MKNGVAWRGVCAVVRGAAVVLAVAGAGAACGGGTARMPVAGSMDADKFLFQRGMESLKEKKWIATREYFRRLIDTYPTSAFRFDAKLGIGDAYLGEGRIDSLILAANEFREFLTFFPVAERVDYAQYKLAVALSRQTLSAQRDQTATHDALKEIAVFQKTYPNSALKPEVDKLYRQMRDLLSESEFAPGLHYYRTKWYQGAIERFASLLREDPEFTHRDKVIFYLAESLRKFNAVPEAQIYYEKLIADMPQSKYAMDAAMRFAYITR